MKVTIELTKPLSDIASSDSVEIEFDGATLRDLLEEFVRRYPGIRDLVFNDTGELGSDLMMFINDRLVQTLGGLDASLSDGDRLSVFMAVSGG